MPRLHLAPPQPPPCQAWRGRIWLLLPLFHPEPPPSVSRHQVDKNRCWTPWSDSAAAGSPRPISELREGAPFHPPPLLEENPESRLPHPVFSGFTQRQTSRCRAPPPLLIACHQSARGWDPEGRGGAWARLPLPPSPRMPFPTHSDLQAAGTEWGGAISQAQPAPPSTSILSSS